MCTNCSGNHPAYDKLCPKYQQSKEILKIQVENKCTMKEAITLYKNQIPSIIGGPSFASVTQNFNTLNQQQQNDSSQSLNNSKTNNLPPTEPQQLNPNLPNNTSQQNIEQNINHDNPLSNILTQLISNQQHTGNTTTCFTHENIYQQFNAFTANNTINNDNLFSPVDPLPALPIEQQNVNMESKTNTELPP
ncbi:GATA zinc finger domain-containing protein 13-like [Anastrepha obliqua]|uniref:GATA zinc finger domain-containing protein 13-like n=1 Tax=Anastrepha obliqua TaxID=95512 RepID=UPI0024094F27|nr:GATA zinc finger domain-containing protein 13-like [Anastrepha obliqua]